MKRFTSKSAARQAVWDALQETRVARFPFPPHGRIPNFAGAREAAERLLDLPELRAARTIKVNPDAPQRPVRLAALRRGLVVFMPTPRLRAGFVRFDPSRIPDDKLASAASLAKGRRWGEEVPVTELPRMDLIVTGSVAVTLGGRRCGKGHGYGDIEYAILRELGHPPVPVLTTVHPLQIVGSFPADEHDLPVSIIVTPERVVRVRRPPSPPEGIDWKRLSPAAIEEMPVLGEIRAASGE